MADAAAAPATLTNRRPLDLRVPRERTLTQPAIGDVTLMGKEAAPMSQAESSRQGTAPADGSRDPGDNTGGPPPVDTMAPSARPKAALEPRTYEYPSAESGFEVSLGPLK